MKNGTEEERRLLIPLLIVRSLSTREGHGSRLGPSGSCPLARNRLLCSPGKAKTAQLQQGTAGLGIPGAPRASLVGGKGGTKLWTAVPEQLRLHVWATVCEILIILQPAGAHLGAPHPARDPSPAPGTAGGAERPGEENTAGLVPTSLERPPGTRQAVPGVPLPTSSPAAARAGSRRQRDVPRHRGETSGGP